MLPRARTRSERAQLPRLLAALDVLLAALAMLVGMAAFGIRALLARTGSHAKAVRRSIVYLGTGNLDQVEPRNGANLFLFGECSDFQGFFSRVFNVAFPAGQRKQRWLTDRHLLIDFDLPLAGLLERLGLRHLARALREVAFLHWGIGVLSKLDAAIVEATNPYLQGLNAFLLARALGLPYAILITRHYDFDYESLGKLAFPTLFPSRRVEKLVERLVLRNADLVLADRAHYVNYALANGASAARARQTRVVVDPAYYTEPATRPNPRARLGLAEGRLLLCPGRLQVEKLPEDVLRCLALVRSRGVDARLAFAGEGELRPSLERLAGELGVRAHVHFLGSVPLEDLAGLMSAADVIVCAHMGYTLLEAALSARPIVTYDYEWHPEVIQHGETGMLVPFRDVDGMADWVARLLADPVLAERLGSAARRFALERHGREAVMADYQQYYRSVLDSPA